MKGAGAAIALLLAACASSATTGDTRPSPRETPPVAPPSEGGAATEREGRGRAVTVRPDPHVTIIVRRQDTVSMELPAGTQVQSLDRTTFITATAERSGDAHRMTFVLDSVVAAPGGFLPPDSLAAAAGTRWTGRLLPDGQLVDLTMDTVRGRPRTTLGEQTARTLEVLFPVLPEGGARPGATWSDSVETGTELGGFRVTERGLIEYSATSRAGGGLEVTGHGTLRQQGSGTQFGQELEMSGEGERRISYQLEESGRLAGASGTDSAALQIIVPAVGQTVPMAQNSRFDVTIRQR